MGAENIRGIHVSWLNIAVNLKLLPKSLRRRNTPSQFRKLGKIDETKGNKITQFYSPKWWRDDFNILVCVLLGLFSV